MNSSKYPVNDNMAVNVLINMKKCLIWVLLLGAGFSLFAQNNPNASIYIPPVTGFGKNQDDNEVIATMLTNEIKSRNGVLGNSLQKADFILYGTIAPYHEEEQYYHNYIYLNVKDASSAVTVYTYNPMLRNSPEQVYIFQLILKNEKTNQAMLVQNLLYTSIDTVYDFFPLLIHNIFSQMNAKPVYIYDDSWCNKWLYFRTSFDFPITLYKLKPDGLINETGIYEGTFETPNRIQQLDNKVVALPGVTIGLELQFLKWMSIEPNFQINWEYLNDKDFINMAAGLELKFPLKFIRNVMLEPYGAALYPVHIPLLSKLSSEVFDSFPLFAFGGGFQLGIKGGGASVAFIDVNYMYYYGDTVVNNPYGELYPQPKVIHYQRSVLGLGVGFKFGVGSRK
jgi:hypothetical protein